MVDTLLGIKAKLQQIEETGLYRSCPEVEHRTGRTIKIGGQEYLNFTSNDYMGLASSDLLKNALKTGAELYGVGTGASPLVTGLTKAHADLAQKVCAITGKEAALVFSSGFAANQAIVKALNSLGADLIFDKYAHASMQDAASYIGKFHRYPHGDLVRAQSLLQALPTPVILTEGVFSMDGDSADLVALEKIKALHPKCMVVLDDAHGFGVLGPQGHGTPSAQGVSFAVADIYMGTLSKAIGVGGAFVAASRDFIEYLINTSREYIYSTSMPGAMAYTASVALDYIETHNELRTHLHTLIKTFKTSLSHELQAANLTIGEHSLSETSIQPIVLGPTERTMRVASYLKSQGIWAGAMRPPTVPRGTSRLRLTITAAHTMEDVQQLVSTLVQGVKHA